MHRFTNDCGDPRLLYSRCDFLDFPRTHSCMVGVCRHISLGRDRCGKWLGIGMGIVANQVVYRSVGLAYSTNYVWILGVIYIYIYIYIYITAGALDRIDWAFGVP